MIDLLLLTLLHSFQQSQPPVFSVDVEAVQVDVFVGRDGKAVLGLTPDDFELYDNGVRQQIEVLDVENVPAQIALVLDTSTSVEGAKLFRLQEAAHGFLRGLDPKDRAGLITFSHRVRQRSAPTDDLGSLHQAIDHVEPGGATVWRDALFCGLKMVERESQRSIVILFTDGEDTYSWLREEQLTAAVEQSHAVVYTVYGSGGVDEQQQAISQYLGANTPTRYWTEAWRGLVKERQRRTQLLREVAKTSGGRSLEATDGNLEAIFQEILEEMKTRYLLSYLPTGVAQDGWHEIDVKLTRGKVDIRARRGYYRGTAHQAR